MARRKKVTTKESKKADNFRRRLQATGATVGTTELRTMFNNLFQTAV